MKTKTSNKPKVGLITTFFTINYGAILQAYALHEKIKSQGFNCEIVNYTPKGKVYGNTIVYNFSNLRSTVSSLILMFNFKYKKDYKNKVKKFNDFLNDNFTLSNRNYHSYSQLSAGMSIYKTLVCGSDQIWNLNLLNDPAFFLAFDKEHPDINYIAYAPSISEALSEKQYKEIIDKTQHFSSLSLRECQDSAILNKLTTQDIACVLDPVFLLSTSHWLKLSEPSLIKGEFILIYEISSDEVFSNALDRLREIYPYKVVCINMRPYNKHHADILLTDVSPEEFLGLINKAKIVCTSSFHATMFSIIFETQFYAVPAKHRSSRHKNVLNQVGLDSRLIMNLDDIEKCQKIDYSQVNSKLEPLKQKSEDYLHNSL